MPAENEAGVVLTAEDKVSPTLASISDNIDRLEKKIDSSAKSTEKASSNMADAFSSIKTAGLSMTASLTVPLTLLGKTMLDQVANIEQLKISFDTMLGSAQKGSLVLKQVSDFAAKTPFDLPQVAQGTKSLLAYGFAANELIPTLKKIGDVAAGTGTPLNDLIYLFGTLRASGRVTNIDLVQFAGRGIPVYEELGKVMGVTADKVRGLAKEGKIGFTDVEKAFGNMTGEGGRFFNLMDAQSKSFGGVMSNLRDNFVRVSISLLGLSTDASTFGQIIEGGLFDRVKTVIESLLVTMDKMVKYFQGMSASTKQAIADFAIMIAVMGPLAIGIAALASPVGIFVAALVGLAALLAVVKKSLTDLFNEGVDLKFADDLNKGLQKDIKNVEAHNKKIMDDLEQHIEEIKFALEQGDKEMSEKQKKILEDKLKMYEDEKTTAIYNAVEKKQELIKQAVIQATAINGVYDVQNKRILVGWDKTWFTIKEDFKDDGRILIGIFGFVVDEIISLISSVGTAVKTTFNSYFGNLTKIFKAGNAKDVTDAVDGLLHPLEAFKDGLSAQYKGIGSDYEKNVAKLFSVANDSANKKLENRGGLFNFKEELAKARLDAEETGSQIADALRVGGGGSPAPGTGGSDAKKKENELKKQIDELGKSLEDFGVFSVRLGDKILGTFSNARDGVKKVKDEIVKIAEKSASAIKEMASIQNKISQNREILGSESTPVGSISTYEGLNDAIKEVGKSVDDLISKHKDFINQAVKGIEEYGDKARKIQEDAVAAIAKVGEDAAKDVGKSYGSDLTELDKVTESIKAKQEEQNSLSNDPKKFNQLDKELQQLKEKKKTLEDTLETYKKIADGKYETGDVVAEAKNRRSNLVLDPNKDFEEQKKDLDAQLAFAEKFKDTIQKGRELLKNDALKKAQESLDDEEAKRNLSEIDYIAFSSAKKVEAIETEKNAKLKALQDLQIIYQNITAGTVGNLNVADLQKQGFSQEAIDLATKAQEELKTYQSQLDGKLVILKGYKDQEASIYASAVSELQTQQAILESYVSSSLDRLVGKYKELEAAAKIAAAAQSTVLGVVSAPTSVKPTAIGSHAIGGYTANISPSQVAGVVHGGEWVAPKWMVDSMRPVFEALEIARSRGFADGGNVPSPTYNQPITMNNNIHSSVDFMESARKMAWLLRTR